MATKSTIAVIHEDHTISQIYCHYDGQLTHNGKLLSEKYDTLLRVEFLISKGDLNMLREKVTPNHDLEHSFNNPQKDVCLYYGRDGDNDDNVNTEPRKFANISDYRLYLKSQDLNYLFVDGRWMYQLKVNDPVMRSVVEHLQMDE